jgi:hypothetical protein
VSCHPDGGRPDGLNWDLILDGVGNAKNTKSLLLAHQTPPTTITGTRANAEVSVRSEFLHIEFSSVLETDAVAVDAYLKSLEPAHSPFSRMVASAPPRPVVDRHAEVRRRNGSWREEGDTLRHAYAGRDLAHCAVFARRSHPDFQRHL